MAAPTNQTAATAIELGPLPNAIPQRVDDAGTTYTVWYKFTAPASNAVIGIWAFGDLATYTPTLNVFSPDSVTSYLSLVAVNVPVQFSVTAGQVYYLQVVPNSGNPKPANLVISGLPAPSLVPARGSFVICDDTNGFPGTVITAVDGSVLRYVSPFPSGEAGIMLLTATTRTRLLWHDSTARTFVLFDNELNRIANVDASWVTILNAVVSRNQSQTFYVADRGQGVNAVVKTLSTSGVYGATVWTLPQQGLTAMAPNAGETILYNAGQNGSISAPIKQWNLVTSTMGADLVAGITNYEIDDLLVLADTTILATHYRLSNGDTNVHRYNTSGTLLNTYAFGTVNVGSVPRICHALDDANSFWLWIHKSGGNSRFVNVKVSDGTLLRDFSVASYEGGIFQPAATQTPTRFGASQSCPLLLLPLDPSTPCAG